MPSSNFLPTVDGCRPTMDRWHYEIHKGRVFEVNHYNLALASSGTIVLAFRAGAKEIHLEDEISVLGGSATIAWYDAPTLATAGTVIATPNRKRNSTNTPLVTVELNPTVTTVGTSVFGQSVALGDTTNRAKAGTAISGQEERILSESKVSILKLTAIGAVAVKFFGLFYEETP